VLHDVLSVLARAEHVPAEREDPGAMALEGHLEGQLVAAPDLLNKALVAGQSEESLGANEA
jgi:hypothetical protein